MLPIPGNVVVRADDTDILVILSGNLQDISPEFHVWMEFGHFTKNNLRMVDVSNHYTSLDSTLAHSLPGFLAFTGCDFTRYQVFLPSLIVTSLVTRFSCLHML